MDKFRFLTTTSDTDIVLATVVTESSLEGARAKLNGRFASNEEVVAVDVWQGTSWKLVQGAIVDADKICRHTLTPIGVVFEGESVATPETQIEVEQPEKLAHNCDYYAALETAEPPVKLIKVWHRQPLIVQIMGYFSIFLAIAGVFVAYELSGEQWNNAINAGIWMGAFVPAFVFGVFTYAMKYVASIQQTLFRIELATQRNG